MRKIISVLLLVALFAYSGASADGHEEFYPLLAVVTACGETDRDCLVITCRDTAGTLWTFYDEAPWTVGDPVRLLVWEPGREVIDVSREGNLRDLLLTEWRDIYGTC